MKRIYLILLFFVASLTYAQVGIGTATPSDAAMLEVDGGNATSGFRGFMPPRVPTITDRNSIMPTPADQGLVVFVEATGCLDIWSGTSWESIYCLGNILRVWVNEIHYQNNGTDVDEFIEVAGVAGTDLTGYSIRLYNGNGGGGYGNITLSGVIDDESNGYGALEFYEAGIQNGGSTVGEGDGFALIDPDGNVLQFLSYNGFFTATNQEANGLTSTDIGIEEDNTTLATESLQLSGTGSNYADFIWVGPQANSPGDLNSGQTFN